MAEGEWDEGWSEPSLSPQTLTRCGHLEYGFWTLSARGSQNRTFQQLFWSLPLINSNIVGYTFNGRRKKAWLHATGRFFGAKFTDQRPMFSLIIYLVQPVTVSLIEDPFS